MKYFKNLWELTFFLLDDILFGKYFEIFDGEIISTFV